MRSLPLTTRVLIVCTVVASAVITTYAAIYLPVQGNHLWWLVFLCAAMAGEALRVSGDAESGTVAEFTFSMATLLAAAPLFGPGVAAVLGFVSLAAVDIARGEAPYRWVFNASTYALAGAGAGCAFLAAGGRLGVVSEGDTGRPRSCRRRPRRRRHRPGRACHRERAAPALDPRNPQLRVGGDPYVAGRVLPRHRPRPAVCCLPWIRPAARPAVRRGLSRAQRSRAARNRDQAGAARPRRRRRCPRPVHVRALGASWQLRRATGGRTRSARPTRSEADPRGASSRSRKAHRRCLDPHEAGTLDAGGVRGAALAPGDVRTAPRPVHVRGRGEAPRRVPPRTLRRQRLLPRQRAADRSPFPDPRRQLGRDDVRSALSQGAHRRRGRVGDPETPRDAVPSVARQGLRRRRGGPRGTRRAHERGACRTCSASFAAAATVACRQRAPGSSATGGMRRGGSW